MTGRSIAKSSAVDTFNQSWSASGPFTVYRPYASGGPDVLCAEGTTEIGSFPAASWTVRAQAG